MPTGDLGSPLWLTGRRVDSAYRDHVQGLVQHTYLTDRAWRIATTPGSLGGMGLRTWADTADAAYLASYAYSRSIVPSLFPHLGPAFANPFVVGADASSLSASAAAAARANGRLVAEDAGCTAHLAALAPVPLGALASDSGSVHGLQRRCSELLHATRVRHHFQGLGVRDRAEHFSHAGDPYFPSCSPTAPDLTISSDLFSIATARRLLLQITTCSCEVKRCVVCNSSDVDEMGDHSLRCAADSNPLRRTEWHDASYWVWHQLFRMAGWESRMEVTGALIGDSNKRPDIMIFRGVGGSDVFIDFITCLPTKADVVNSAASTPGHAADLGAAKKMGDWLDLVQRQGDEFVPIAVESGGRVHEDALDLLSEACGAIGGSPGERQALLTYWRQRVSMANARGVAAVIKARTPLCTGVHHPVQPHHFSHQSAIPAPLRPQQTPHQAALPALTAWPLLRPPAGAGFCLPCAPNPHSLLVGADDAGLVAGHASG